MQSDRAANNQNALDDAVWIVFELIAIGEGAGLALVGIATYVDRLLRLLRNEAPVRAVGNAAPPRPRKVGIS